MEIITTTSISLTDNEKEALNVFIRAYEDCIYSDKYDCDVCPLYVEEQCIGRLCERVKGI